MDIALAQDEQSTPGEGPAIPCDGDMGSCLQRADDRGPWTKEEKPLHAHKLLGATSSYPCSTGFCKR